MKRHSFCVALTAVTALLGIAAPSSATTFKASIDPAAPGTPSAPGAHRVTFDLQGMKSGADGNPTVATLGIDQVLPPDFVSGFDAFGACDKASVASSGAKEPTCPQDSVLGTLQIKTFVPALRASATSDRGFLYKTGADSFIGWFHVSRPVEVGGSVEGTLKVDSSSQALTASWDFAPIAQGKNGAGLEIRVSSWVTSWTGTASGAAAPAPTSRRLTCMQKARRVTNRRLRASRIRACRRVTCLQKARRIKNRKRRASRIRACRRPASGRKGRAATAVAAVHSRARTRQAATGGEISPFRSIRCTGGRWPLRVDVTYADGSSETLTQDVPCTADAQPPTGNGLLDDVLPPP